MKRRSVRTILGIAVFMAIYAVGVMSIAGGKESVVQNQDVVKMALINFQPVWGG